LENAVMTVVWQKGACGVETVHDVVSDKRNLKEATVRTVLRRLEHKGYLRHEIQGRAYVYRATESARNLAARAVRQIVDRLCRGSIEELLSGMVEAKALSENDLKTLEELIRDHRRSTARQDQKNGK
jgi:BlaI family penicillinase repressor